MEVLAPGSAHTWPSAWPPIDTNGESKPHAKSNPSGEKGEERERKQAGAELCQAQEKLGLAKPALPVVVFHLL